MLQINFYLLRKGEQKMIIDMTIGISPCIIWEIKREVFRYIITYLCTYGLWVDSGNKNAGGENGKTGLEME